MNLLAKKYHPILCTPFGREGYREAASCAALAPEQLVIPLCSRGRRKSTSGG